MAVNTVKVQINGTWVTLTKNSTTGKYEGTIAAPNVTSYNVNTGHYYPVTVEATDLAGNKTTKTPTDSTIGDSLKLYVKETVKPTITVSSPTSGSFITTNTPAISFTIKDEANGSGIKLTSLVLKIDNTSYTNTSTGMTLTSTTNGYDGTFTPTEGLSDGEHTITINVQDNDGNAAIQSSVTFTVDTVPPVLTVTSPSLATSYTNKTSLTVSGTTSDTTSGNPVVTIKLNGTDQGTITLNSGAFSKAITLASGTNTILIRSTDAAGKYSEVTRTVILDTTPPTITSVTITPNPVNCGASYVVSVEATD